MEWQPIRSAPKNKEGEKDGPAIILWNEHDRTLCHGFWATFIEHGGLVTGWSFWSSTGRRRLIRPSLRVTHWMPLPDPPDATP